MSIQCHIIRDAVKDQFCCLSIAREYARFPSGEISVVHRCKSQVDNVMGDGNGSEAVKKLNGARRLSCKVPICRSFCSVNAALPILSQLLSGRSAEFQLCVAQFLMIAQSWSSALRRH